MHRAKTNIEILVGVLEAEGYEFRPAVYSPYWRRTQKSKEWTEEVDEAAQVLVASLQEPLMNLPEFRREQVNASRTEMLTQSR